MLRYLKALSVFAGTIIGVGIFGLPYIASKAGFLVVILYFLLMVGIVSVVQLIYGEVSLGTKELHRLPGYVGQYLGEGWKKISLIVTGFGFIGALLAYLIVGGEFLASFLAPYLGGNTLIYTSLFFAIGAFLIFRGIKSISLIELILLIVFFFILILFFIKAFPFIDVSYFKNIDLKFITLPYGVILFSLWGASIVPEIKEMLKGDRKMLRKVIISGVLLAAVTYLFFVFTVFGASGDNTSKEAISGLAHALGDNVVRFGFVFGLITCFTSFITIGLGLKKIFWYDFNLSKNLSWFIACSVPFLLFLLGLREFIDIIGLVGALAIGCEGIIIVLMYKKFYDKMNSWFYVLPAFFVLGIFFEFFYFVVR